MKNKYTRAFDAIEVDEQKKQETINKVIEYRNKQANNAPNNSTRRTLKSFMFYTKRGIAIITACFMFIIALSVGIPLGLNYGGNSNTIIESLTVANSNAYIEYDTNKENQMPLDVKVKYKGSAERNATSDDVIFTSSNDSIVAVDKNGLVTVSGVGKASIIVESKKNTSRGEKILKTVNLPIIDVVSMNSSISINTKVTLPKIGTNAEPFISVKYDGEDVKVANVDPITGYAVGLTNEKVEFNNDDKMFFYPTKEGTYTVEYYVVDNLGNKSIPAVYHVFCSDRTAPLFVGEALQIPLEWGAKVFENGLEVSNIINFARPQFIDNSGEPVTISFAIRDTLNHIIVNFPDINETAMRSIYYDDNGDNVEFTQEGFEFDIAKYVNHANLPQNGLGRFTVIYTARDTAGNLTKLSFEITFYPEYTKA